MAVKWSEEFLRIVVEDHVAELVRMGFILIGALLLHLTKNRLFKRLYPKVTATPSIWDDALLHAADKPSVVLIWTLALFSILQLMVGDAWVEKVKILILLVILFWFSMRAIQEMETNALKRGLQRFAFVDKTTANAVGHLARIITVTAFMLILLKELGVPVGGVIAAGGISGIAIGFASKDMLSNVFGSMIIFFDRPFTIGDWIRIPDKGFEGVVEQIGWRTTQLRTLDKQLMYIPNGLFSVTSISNVSRMSHQPINITLKLRYQDEGVLPAVISDIRAFIFNHSKIDQRESMVVNLTDISQGSLDILVYASSTICDWNEFQPVQEDLQKGLLAILKNHGVTLAYPTTTTQMCSPPVASS